MGWKENIRQGRRTLDEEGERRSSSCLSWERAGVREALPSSKLVLNSANPHPSLCPDLSLTAQEKTAGHWSGPRAPPGFPLSENPSVCPWNIDPALLISPARLGRAASCQVYCPCPHPKAPQDEWEAACCPKTPVHSCVQVCQFHSF